MGEGERRRQVGEGTKEDTGGGKGKSRKGLVEDNLKHNFGDNSVIF